MSMRSRGRDRALLIETPAWFWREGHDSRRRLGTVAAGNLDEHGTSFYYMANANGYIEQEFYICTGCFVLLFTSLEVLTLWYYSIRTRSCQSWQQGQTILVPRRSFGRQQILRTKHTYTRSVTSTRLSFEDQPHLPLHINNLMLSKGIPELVCRQPQPGSCTLRASCTGSTPRKVFEMLAQRSRPADQMYGSSEGFSCRTPGPGRSYAVSATQFYRTCNGVHQFRRPNYVILQLYLA